MVDVMKMNKDDGTCCEDNKGDGTERSRYGVNREMGQPFDRSIGYHAG